MIRALAIILALTACTKGGTRPKGLANSTDGASLVILECFGWCALTEGEAGGRVEVDRDQAQRPTTR